MIASSSQLIFDNPIDAIQRHAQNSPNKLAFLFLEQGEVEADRLTFAELDESARRIAAHLQAICEPGARALLILPTGLDFVKAMFGCLYAGIVPIPTNPPGLNRSAARLEAISADARASLALSTAQFQSMIDHSAEEYPELRALRWVLPGALPPEAGFTWRKPPLSPEQLAFIQYTSGSTNLPKGVMVTFGNLSANRHAMNQVREREEGYTQINLAWTPLFHDMGLLLGVFQGIFDGHTSLLMSPIAFIQKPIRWLQAISRYRVTFSGGPNFAYEVCVDKINPSQCAGLDLTCWRTAYNGAEPVRAETQARFAEKFAPFGFEAETLHPCYGLAEATLVVSGRGVVRGKTVTFPAQRAALEQGKIVPAAPGDEQNSQPLVSCGPPLIDIQAAIVDPFTLRRCPPDQVGEVWLRGSNIAAGYWNRPADTEASFNAMIQDSNEGPYLRTGDLGFIHQGELYITGRHKDLIIIRGRNYYPQDIEYTVQKSHPALRPGSGAAFTIQRDTIELLVVVQEVRDPSAGEDWGAIMQKIRFDIAREHGIRAYCVVLLERNSAPKTSSGKIQRAEARALFLANQFPVVARWCATG